MLTSAELQLADPLSKGGSYHSLKDNKLYTTCGNCQIVCHPDRDERKRRYKMLADAGVVIQNPDGSLEAASPEEAEGRLASMEDERRSIYEGGTEVSPEIQALADHLRSLANGGAK